MGMFGDEIATAEEMEDFLKPQKKVFKDKTFESGHKVNYPKDEPIKNIPTPTKDTKIVANEWIAKLKEQAKHSVSVNKFEQGIQSLSNEYLDELKQIALDPLEELRVEEEYNKLKTQIQGRK